MLRQYVTLKIRLEAKGLLCATFEGTLGTLLVFPEDMLAEKLVSQRTISE